MSESNYVNRTLTIYEGIFNFISVAADSMQICILCSNTPTTAIQAHKCMRSSGSISRTCRLRGDQRAPQAQLRQG